MLQHEASQVSLPDLIVEKMVAGCGNKCVKYFFFFVNFLFFMLGGVVCGLALWVRFDNTFQQKVLGILQGQNNGLTTNTPIQLDTLYIILYAIAAIGLIIFILGFFGCLGSCMESVCSIGIYFILVLILFVILLAGGIYVLINKENMKNTFISVWRTEFVDKYNTAALPIRTNIDNIHSQLKCCGATGCHDFDVKPISCNCSLTSNYVMPGCATFIYDIIDKNFTIIIIVAAAILVVELAAMIFACILCSAVKEKSSLNF